MAKILHAQNFDLIQSAAQKELLKLGFKGKSRTLNRTLDSGLIHVINFQMGRRSLSGSFTINLGICVPEIYKIINGKDPPGFPDHGDCELTKRIGELVSPGKDLWWDLEKDPGKLSRIVCSHITKAALPYLNRFMTPDDIIREWSEYGEEIGLPPRAGLSIAILLDQKGEQKQARALLVDEFVRKKDEPYAQFVVEIAQKLGLHLSAE